MVGATVGPYQVLARLGAGGMGEVYLGHDVRLQRRVALKCLSGVAETAETRARVLREARAVARLNHPNIAAVHDVLEDGDRTFIVMEYVEGESLSARIARGPASPGEVRLIGRQLASALAAAHAQGVVHRDLKPANVHIARDGSIKVLDFGVAKLTPTIAASTAAPTEPAAAESTVPGNPGTPIYMSPEQLFGCEVDARSDIYSAGVILFELATGRRPFPETNAVALALAMSSSAAPSVSSIDAAVPADLSGAIAKALDRDVANRWQSARELESALAGPGPAPLVRNSRWRTGLGAALAAIAIAATVAAAVRFRPLASTGTTQPVVLAVLPVDNPTADEHAEYLGAGIASVVTQNFGSVSGITVLLRSATAPYANKRSDRATLNREVGATYVLDLALTSLTPKPMVYARLYRHDSPQPVWEANLAGDPLTIESALVDQLGRTLERAGHSFTREEWGRIRRLPTKSGAALSAYSEARALLNRPQAPDIDRVIGLLKQATDADPDFALAWALLGDAWWSKYQNGAKDPAFVANANAAVNRAIQIAPGAAPVHYSLAILQFRTGKFEAAEGSLRRALEIQPEFDEAMRLLAQVLSSLGRVDEAEAVIRQALTISNNWNNWFVLGTIRYRAGRYEDAVDAFRRTTQVMPANSAAFQMLGTAQYVLGRVDDAIGNYEHAVRLSPNATAHANLAMAYYDSGRFDAAMHSYEEAIRLNPNVALNHRNLADVLLRVGRADEARAEYRKAIELANAQLANNPRDVRAIGLVALCEARLGLAPAARKHAAEAVAVDPTSREAWQRSAEVHALLGDSEKALRDLEAAVVRGFEPRMARTEDELAALRKLPKFEDILRNSRERLATSKGAR